MLAIGSTLLIPADPASAGDVSEFRFTLAKMSVGEGAGIATVTVEKTGGGGGGEGGGAVLGGGGSTVTVSTSPGSATAPGDYTTVVTVLEFGAGPGTRTVDIPIVNDAEDEASEVFTVGLSDPSQGTSLGAPATMTITIIDNDEGQPTSIHFAGSSLTVGEGIGSASITVFRTGPRTTSGSATYTVTDGTAIAGSDHSGVGGTVLFEPGHGVESILVPILQDTLDEPDETLSLTITSVSPGAVIGTPSMITVTIVDDDDEVLGPTIGFASSGASVSESAGTVLLEIVCGQGADASTSASITVDGSADDADADVVGTANCADEGIESVIAVEVDDDNLPEADETVVVTLSAPTNGATLVPFPAFTLTIEASDVQPDAAISRERGSAWRGVGIINETGIGQTSTGWSRYPHEGRTRYIRITQNSDGPFHTIVRRNVPENVEVHVFQMLSDGSERDITHETLSGYRIELVDGDVARLRVTLRFERLLPEGASRTAKFTTRRNSDVIRRDAVRFRLYQR